MHQKNIWYEHAGLHKEVHDLDLMEIFFSPAGLVNGKIYNFKR